ncbi:hypothetical protein [Gordonia sp. YC-JH1]|uniref:hypothetical protein n=1 Tax=Gordonia sp. YC-JH1 TaxID=2059875 RepID=UPI002D773415|nr:hypothetical protein [Gordonia sp. YC-JH1]
MTSTPPESEFGPALARLFRQAGKPTLRAASEGMARFGRAEATPQRISDWRNGRHVPRDFDTVLPLIMWLNRRALDAGADDLVSMPEWRRLWERHHDPASGARLDTPFPGLASMGARDRDRYFGRDDTIAALSGLLSEARDSAGNRVVVVTGVSGRASRHCSVPGSPAPVNRGTPRSRCAWGRPDSSETRWPPVRRWW